MIHHMPLFKSLPHKVIHVIFKFLHFAKYISFEILSNIGHTNRHLKSRYIKVSVLFISIIVKMHFGIAKLHSKSVHITF